jgi:hypothetical protein
VTLRCEGQRCAADRFVRDRIFVIVQEINMRASIVACLVLACCTALLLAPAPARAADVDTATPTALVETYESLANAILAAKQTEWNLVHSILAGTYQHAKGVMRIAEGKLQAGQSARDEIETLAALVAQLGNEGDGAVAAVRKRLLEGGHHHHATGEEQGLYDEGFVIITREARKTLLDAGKRIGRMSGTKDADALRAEWSVVEKKFLAVCEAAKG